MTLGGIIDALERFAPLAWQEEYDNNGLQVGLFDEAGMPLGCEAVITGVLVCLDITEAVIDEAAARGCNLVVSHHPLIFRPLKAVTGTVYQQRCVAKAMRLGIALYAAHTNLDNAPGGVSWEMASRLGLQDIRPLVPLAAAPASATPSTSTALVSATSSASAAPAACPSARPGSGVIGVLPRPVPAEDFVRTLADVFDAPHLRYCLPTASASAFNQTPNQVGGDAPASASSFAFSSASSFAAESSAPASLSGDGAGNAATLIRTVALCGGSGGEYIPDALAAGADCYVTGEIRYHDYFEAEGRMLVALGHYESEQYTIDLLCRKLQDIISQENAPCGASSHSSCASPAQPSCDPPNQSPCASPAQLSGTSPSQSSCASPAQPSCDPSSQASCASGQKIPVLKTTLNTNPLKGL